MTVTAQEMRAVDLVVTTPKFCDGADDVNDRVFAPGVRERTSVSGYGPDVGRIAVRATRLRAPGIWRQSLRFRPASVGP